MNFHDSSSDRIRSGIAGYVRRGRGMGRLVAVDVTSKVALPRFAHVDGLQDNPLESGSLLYSRGRN